MEPSQLLKFQRCKKKPWQKLALKKMYEIISKEIDIKLIKIN